MIKKILSYTFSTLAMNFCNKSLNVTLVEICTSRGDPLLHSVSPPTASLCSHALPGLHKCSVIVDECHWVQFFLHEKIQLHTFALYALHIRYHFIRVLPSATWQKHLMEYWCQGSNSAAMTPISTSDVVSWQNKIGGITFGAPFIFQKVCFASSQSPSPFAGVCLLYAQFVCGHALFPCQRLAGRVTCISIYFPQFNTTSVCSRKGICFVSVASISTVAIQES